MSKCALSIDHCSPSLPAGWQVSLLKAKLEVSGPQGGIESRRPRRRNPHLKQAAGQEPGGQDREPAATRARRLSNIERRLSAAGAHGPGGAPLLSGDMEPSDGLRSAQGEGGRANDGEGDGRLRRLTSGDASSSC